MKYIILKTDNTNIVVDDPGLYFRVNVKGDLIVFNQHRQGVCSLKHGEWNTIFTKATP